MYIINPKTTTKHSLSIEEIEWNYKKFIRKRQKERKNKSNEKYGK